MSLTSVLRALILLDSSSTWCSWPSLAENIQNVCNGDIKETP